MDSVLLTGATGFLGSNLARALLRAGKQVFAPVRGKDQSPKERVHRVLRRLDPELDLTKLHVFEADISSPLFGLDKAELRLLRDCEIVIHAAGNPNFIDRIRGEIWIANVETTRQALDFCGYVGAAFCHYSTAYVTHPAVNDYLISKREAEELVKCWSEEASHKATILSPSIIAGNSCDGISYSDKGYLGYMSGIWWVRSLVLKKIASHQEVMKSSGIYLDGQTLRLPSMGVAGDPRASLSITYIDFVVETSLKLIRSQRAWGKRFFLVPSVSKTFGYWLEESLKVMQVEGICVSPDGSLLAPDGEARTIEKLFRRTLEPFDEFVSGEPEWDTSNLREAIEEMPIHPETDSAMICHLLKPAMKADFDFRWH